MTGLLEELGPEGQRWLTDPHPLQTMLDLQNELETQIYGNQPLEVVGDERADYVRTMVLALEDELHEAMAEVGWKPWADSSHFNREQFVGELIDAWHFFMNLLLLAGVTERELYIKYLRKRAKNVKRQEEGYDGVTGKCAWCHRDLGEIENPEAIVHDQYLRSPLSFCDIHHRDIYFDEKRYPEEARG